MLFRGTATTVSFQFVSRLFLMALIGLIFMPAAFAQGSYFITDGQDHLLDYSGTYQDLYIPDNTQIQMISFYIKGGSGGAATTTLEDYPDIDPGTTPAGGGAIVQGTYYVGDQPGYIKPGSIVRFIIGGHGETGIKAADQSVGGGGGASAILIKQPGESGFTHLLIAGGGGGACRGQETRPDGAKFLHKKPGVPGRSSSDGSAGTGANYPTGGTKGPAGTDGDGGGAGTINANQTPVTCGGGGYLSSGTNNDCGQGAGNQAHPSGAVGGNGNCQLTNFYAGGYGYGSGGAGVYIELYAADGLVGGGGGGGFSGGGGGSVVWGGGGGGGSAISYDKFYQLPGSNLILAGATVMANENGEASYYCHMPPGSFAVAHCKNITLPLTDNNTFLNPYDVVGDGAEGTGSGYSVSPSVFHCWDIGKIIPVTLTVAGYITNDQCTALVTIEDKVGPVITCPNAIVQNTDAGGPLGTCGAHVYYSQASAVDNCGLSSVATVSVLAGPASGSLFPVGTSTVTFKATDEANNTSTCSFQITVQDIQAPQIYCPPNLTKNTDPGQCSAVTSFYATGVDNCGISSVVQTAGHASNSAFPTGVSTVVFKATDESGNTQTCSFTITVTDKEAPVASCKNKTLELNAAGKAILSTDDIFQSGSDNCGAINQVSVSPNLFTCNDLGLKTATLTVDDGHGNTATCTATITVLDKRAPTVICQNLSLTLDASGQATLTPQQVDNGSYDNCAIVALNLSQTSFNCANLGPQQLLLSGADASGNKAECISLVTIRDLTAPVAKCKNATVQLNAQGAATIAANLIDNGSSDACGITSSTLSVTSLSCANTGVNQVVLNVSDASGNSSSCTAMVTVKDLIAPQAKCKNITVYLNDAGQAGITAAQIDNGSSDACGIQSLTINTNSFNCGQLNSNVPVWLTVKDLHNNTASCQSMVTVKDNLAPVAICENVTVQLNAQGKATVYGAALAGSSYDNCSVWSYAPISKQYTAAQLGENNLTITVKDWSGNTATCIAQVTVLANNGNLVVVDASTPEDGGEQAEDDQTAERQSTTLHDEDLRLFPNPANGHAALTFQLEQKETLRLKLFDASGRVVLDQVIEGLAGDNRIELELGEQPAGLYWVSVQAARWQAQRHLLLARD